MSLCLHGREVSCNECAKEQEQEQLPDMSAAIASMGRGSMQRRIQKLEMALAAAEHALNNIAFDKTRACIQADNALDRIAQILRG